MYWWLIHLALWRLAASEDQYFVKQPEDVTANIGDQVTLHCLVANRQGVLQWTKNGFGLGTDPALPGFPRYSLTKDLSLQIQPVAEEDVGEFQCQVGGGDTGQPIRSQPARLTVQLPPGEPRILGGEDGVVSVSEGGTGFLECESAGGKPAASIDWRGESGKSLHLDSVNTRTMRDEKTKTFKTVSSLRFQVERSMHNKTIVCTASNIASTEPRSVSVRLNVMYRPKVSLGINTGAGSVTEGDNVVMHCNADANPAPYTFTWRRNGIIVPGKQSQYLMLDNIDSSYHNAVIECEAKNSLGADASSKTLNLQFGPQMVLHPRSVAAKEGEEVTLRCRATSNPPPRYVWMKDNNPQPIEFSDTLTTRVSAYTVGRYRCQALVEGFETVDSKSAVVTVLEKPRIEKIDTQYGTVGEDVEIICPVLSTGQALNITWYLRGRLLVEGGKYLMGRSVREDRVDGILRIRQATDIDFGEYGCRADNEIGADYASIMVKGASGFNVLEYLPFIGCGVGGVLLVLLVLLVVYCVRRGRRGSRLLRNQEELTALNNEKPGEMKVMNEIVFTPGPDILGSGSMRSTGERRSVYNIHPDFAASYANRNLNSRLEDENLSSRSSSHSNLNPDSWRVPPNMRRSQSPYNSEGIDYSTNSTMSSVVSRGSRFSRSQAESTLSSGEESPLISTRFGGYHPRQFEDAGRPGVPRGGHYSDSEDGGTYGRGRMSRGSHSDGEDGRSRPAKTGYYSDGERGGVRRMPRVSEENHDLDREDEDENLSTLSE